ISPARLEARMDSLLSFPVGLFHPLQHAGLSRRTPDRRPTVQNKLLPLSTAAHRTVNGVAHKLEGSSNLEGILLVWKQAARRTLCLAEARRCASSTNGQSTDAAAMGARGESSSSDRTDLAPVQSGRQRTSLPSASRHDRRRTARRKRAPPRYRYPFSASGKHCASVQRLGCPPPSARHRQLQCGRAAPRPSILARHGSGRAPAHVSSSCQPLLRDASRSSGKPPHSCHRNSRKYSFSSVCLLV